MILHHIKLFSHCLEFLKEMNDIVRAGAAEREDTLTVIAHYHERLKRRGINQMF